MGKCVGKGSYTLCRATQTGDADDSFVDGAHRQTAQAATRHLIGRLPWLTNMETDVSKRLLRTATASPPFRALQHFKGKASDKGESSRSGKDTDCQCFVSFWLQRVLFVRGTGVGGRGPGSLWAGGTRLQEARDVRPSR